MLPVEQEDEPSNARPRKIKEPQGWSWRVAWDILCACRWMHVGANRRTAVGRAPSRTALHPTEKQVSVSGFVSRLKTFECPLVWHITSVLWHITSVRCGAATRPLLEDHRTGRGHRPTDVIVKGFGCRPLTNRAACTGGRRPKACNGGNRDGWSWAVPREWGFEFSHTV